MGYYASGSGVILLQKENKEGYEKIAEKLEVDPKNVLNAIYEEIENVFAVYTMNKGIFDTDEKENAYSVDVSYEYTNYYGETITELLDLIVPVLKESTYIAFSGDDDCNWIFRCLEDGSYVEANGEIIYAGPECWSKTCAYANHGECRFHAVFGRYPKRGKAYEMGCSEYIRKNGAKEYLEKDVIEILTEEGQKYVHFMGYAYYFEGDGDEYRIVEYVHNTIPLDVLMREPGKCSDEFHEEYNAGHSENITDCDEIAVIKFYETGFGGKTPAPISLNNLRFAPDGFYLWDSSEQVADADGSGK